MKQLVLRLIRIYQSASVFNTALARTLFMSDSICRFTPTCSEYATEAIEKYGVGKGIWLALKRVLRCHPFSKGGSDPLT